MKMKARRRVYYNYPVELVWKAIGFGSENHGMDPLSEDEFENTEPAPNTVYTRALEIKDFKVFAFQMKSRLFYSTMRIEMESRGPIETMLRVSQEIEPRSRAGFFFCLFTMNVKSEVKKFTNQLHKKLDDEYSGKQD